VPQLRTGVGVRKEIEKQKAKKKKKGKKKQSTPGKVYPFFNLLEIETGIHTQPRTYS
jgi:hypothetical protein